MTERHIEAIHAACHSNPLAAYVALGFEPATVTDTEARGPCILHGGQRPDSLSVRLTGDGAGLWHCFADCGDGGDLIEFAGRQEHGVGWQSKTGQAFRSTVDRIAESLGLGQVAPGSVGESKPRIVAEYDYRDESGELLFQVIRLMPKGFRQRRPAGTGWDWNLRKVRRILYRLPDLIARPEEVVFLVEGEKDADTLHELGLLATTNPMGAKHWRAEYEDLLEGRHVVVVPDADSEGRAGAEKKARSLLRSAGSVKLLELPGLADGEDVSDWVASGGTADKLLQLAERLSDLRHDGAESGPPQPPPLYVRTESGIQHCPPEKPRRQLTNFGAEIVEEVMVDDGVESTRHYRIEAECGGNKARFDTPASAFSSMAWVECHLGATAILAAGFGIKDHVRAAIQTLSGNIVPRRVFGHTGWRQVGSDWAYLHAGGAITGDGLAPDIRVDLPEGLSSYELPAPPADSQWSEDVAATLRLLDLGPDEVMLPLFASIWRSVIAHSPYSIHLSGRTGTFKSQLSALAAQFFGPSMIAERLPGSWSSTANALEGLAFALKDSTLVIDDFAPEGSSTDIQRLHREAARLLRAQANGAGRRRMRADTTLRPEKPPRGSILSTGEDVPRGQSILARLLILEISPGSIRQPVLSACQADAADGAYARAMAGYLRRLAPSYGAVRDRLSCEVVAYRERLTPPGPHRRTATMMAELWFGLESFLQVACDHGALTPVAASELRERALTAFLRAAEAQCAFQQDTDPVTQFLALLTSALASGDAHVSQTDGSPPRHAERWGYRSRTPEGIPAFEGARIGWVDGDDLYLDREAAYRAAQNATGRLGDGIGTSSRTLAKRLYERGLLRSTEQSSRQTYTVRKLIAGTRRSVLHLAASSLLPETDQPDPLAQIGSSEP